MLKGKAKKDKKTKNLVKRLEANDIAVIYHRDIDEVAAIHLIEKKVKAVINAEISISGKYPNQGPKILCESGIPIIDNIGDDVFGIIQEGDTIEIVNDHLYINGSLISRVNILSKGDIYDKMNQASENLQQVLYEFINNTLNYAQKEKSAILYPPQLPFVNMDFEGKHVLVVVRGKNYKDDLKAIRSYIEEVNPIMIGVDGGGDALLDFGYKPHIIIGDMDSVSDRCLKQCKQIIVHAYSDGRCPGMERINNLKLKASKFPYPGTSEDIALILAYEKRAELIVTVGSHTNMIDFLEKGRPGMASTLLVRMKVGYRVVDAKGVSELYKNRIKPRYIAALLIAAFFPITLVARMSPQIREIYRLLALRLKLILGY